MSIPQNLIDEVIARTDIIGLISEVTPLQKAGKDYKGLCPFHQEKTPSFTASAEKNLYYCFGCGAGGNALGFLMKTQNLSFPEAMSRLAEKCGVRIDFDDKDQTQNKEIKILAKINQYAAWYFQENLKKKDCPARAYLKERGLDEKTVETFRLGYAQESWDGLTRFLMEKKAPLSLAEKLGLIRKRADGSYYDFFRNRLIFPILNMKGEVQGFGGRTLDPLQKEAKYLNSAESALYNKSTSLYGLYQAQPFLRQKKRCILVEGYMDLISMHKNGFGETVAPLGTALTVKQVQTLSRITDQFLLMFDGDEAGNRAFLRSLELLLSQGHHPKVVRLPEGEDPDTYLKKFGPKNMDELLAAAPSAIDWLLVKTLSASSSSAAEKIEAAHKLMPFINALPSTLERKSYQTRVEQFLGLPPGQNLGSSSPSSQPSKKESLPQKLSDKISLERFILQLYLNYPHVVSDLIPKVFFQITDDEFFRKLGAILAEEKNEVGGISAQKLIAKLDPTEASIVSAWMMDTKGLPSEPSQILKQTLLALAQWERVQLKKRLKALTSQIQLAEIENNNDGLNTLLSLKNDILKKLNTLGKET